MGGMAGRDVNLGQGLHLVVYSNGLRPVFSVPISQPIEITQLLHDCSGYHKLTSEP